MKPWIVTVYPNELLGEYGMWGRAQNANGRIYFTRRQQEIDANNDVMAPHPSHQVLFFDDEGTADKYIEYAQHERPSATFVKSKSVSVVYREPGPSKSAIFSDKGLIPQ